MYFLIGISLLFAFLFGVNMVASLGATLLWRILSGYSPHWQAKTKSGIIFALRILPLAVAFIFVFAFMVPAFLTFEPRSSDETVGYKLIIIALVSAFGLIAAFGRVFATWWRTQRLTAEWTKRSERIVIEGVSIPVYRLQHTFPVIAIIGVIRPRMFVASQIFTELNEAEFAAAITHEAGHVSSRDNLKRIAMRISADLLVFPLGRTLDRVWSESAEIAADEFAAAAGGRASAIDLAGALVKIGRIIPTEKAWVMPMGAFLVEPDDISLSTRVERLLMLSDQTFITPNVALKRFRLTIFLVPAFLAASVISLSLNINFLSAIHAVSESLLATLK